MVISNPTISMEDWSRTDWYWFPHKNHLLFPKIFQSVYDNNFCRRFFYFIVSLTLLCKPVCVPKVYTFLFSADWLLPRSAMLSNDVIEQCFKPFQWNQICILFHGLNFHGFYLKMLVFMRNYSLESRNLVNWMKTISRY